MGKMKIGIAGTGRIATKSYLPYLSQREDVELFYYNRTFSKAEDCAKQFGGTAANSPAELMSHDPDTVLFLTHETQRLEAASAFIEFRPRRMFFEKPLHAKFGQGDVCENDFFEARDFLAQLKKANIETAMIFNYRFFDQSQRLRELIASKPLGKLLQASLFVNYNCWSHCIDLLQQVGGRAATISAVSGKAEYGSGKKSPDMAAGFELENGASGTILGTYASDFASALYSGILNFEEGIVKIDDLDSHLSVQMKNSCFIEAFLLSPGRSRWDQYRESFAKSLEAYLDSIARNVPPPVTGMNGLEELQFEAGLRRSAALKRQVIVQEEFPLNF